MLAGEQVVGTLRDDDDAPACGGEVGHQPLKALLHEKRGRHPKPADPEGLAHRVPAAPLFIRQGATIRSPVGVEPIAPGQRGIADVLIPHRCGT